MKRAAGKGEGQLIVAVFRIILVLRTTLVYGVISKKMVTLVDYISRSL